MAETITMPKLGFDMQEGTLVRWVRNEGEAIHKGEVLAEIETDKATVEVESSASGILRKLLVDQGAVVPIGAPIAIVGTKDEKIDVAVTAPTAAPIAETATLNSESGANQGVPAPAVTVNVNVPPGMLKASPLARRMAAEASVDLARVQGSGPGGRIVRRDVEAAISGVIGPLRPSGHGSVQSITREDQVVAVSKLRQAIARRMSESKATIPHFYVTHEFRVNSLMDMREQSNSILSKEEKLSVNDFVVKAAALCLREFPNLNSSYASDKVIRHGSINIGVAVAVEGGLLTVVCAGADQKPVRQISTEIKEMAARARAGKVRPEDIEGSTFTVSNLGMFDVEDFAAIINPPEVAILAVGAARQVAVVDDGAVRPGWRIKATIAVDHRVSDGAEAAQFLQGLAKFLEAPMSLFL